MLSRTIWILSLVSLFTDMAGEMLYPVMPLYLESIGFSIILIGVLEGLAEAAAGLSKGYFGRMSDLQARRLPFVRWGYFLSALSKPLMVAFTWPLWVFGMRTADRLGKGLRTGARDALLSDEALPGTKGRVFGFHRGMDTLGAAIGPAIALLYLYFRPGDYHTLFLLALGPGLLSVAATFLLKERRRPPSGTEHNTFLDFLRYIPRSGVAYRRLIGGLLAFALVNSSDVFLLLMLKRQGMDDAALIGIYIFYNLVYALLAWPAGALADRLGFRIMLIAGLVLFCGVYAGMAFSTSVTGYIALFFFYGLYAACTEGVAKAWISDVCDRKDTATAIGTYEALRSVASLAASTLAGLVWYFSGARELFLLTAIGAAGVAVYFALLKRHARPSA